MAEIQIGAVLRQWLIRRIFDCETKCGEAAAFLKARKREAESRQLKLKTRSARTKLNSLVPSFQRS